MSVRLVSALAASLALAACGGGTIHVEATLPGPSTNGSSGVLVTVPEGTSVCDRVQIHVFKGAPKGSPDMFPADRTPIVSTGGFGTYSREAPRCTMLAQVEPGDDYWVIVSLPKSSYSNGGYPWLPGSGTHPTFWRKGAYPVSAVQGKETRLDLTLEGI